MLKLKLLSIALLATLSTSTMAFSIDSIGKKALGNAAQACMLAGKAIDANGLESQQKNLQAGSKKISQEILAAQTKLAEALDLKQVAANLDAQVKTLKKGNINGDKLDKVTSVSEDANEAIEVQMKKMDSLTAEQKKKVSESLGQYGTAAWDTAKLTGRVVAAGTAMGCVVAQNPMNLTSRT